MTRSILMENKIKILTMRSTTKMDLPAKQKIRLLEFIKNEFSVDDCIEFLTELYCHETEHPKTKKSVMSVLGLVSSPMVWVIYRTILGDHDKCVKQCGTYKINTKTRQACILKCNQKKKKNISNLKAKAKTMKAQKK